MVLGSPSSSAAAKLLYCSGADAEPPTSVSSGIANSNSQDENLEETNAREHGGTSLYIRIFENMLKEVLQHEHELFLQDELECFLAWHRLPYKAKYLFCRLCLRKLDWQRLDDLKYQHELGQSGIVEAIDLLCGRMPDEDVKPIANAEPMPDEWPDFSRTFLEDIKPKIEPEEHTLESTKPPVRIPEPTTMDRSSAVQGPEVIDLTMEEDEEQPQAGPSRLSPEFEPAPPPDSSTPSSTPQKAHDYTIFADDEEQAATWELLECLKVEELEDLAKQLKLKVRGRKRDTLIEALLKGSARQTTLPFVSVSKKGKEPMIQTKLPFDTKKTQKSLMQSKLPFKPTPQCQQTQQERLRVMISKKLKKCVRLNPDVVALFRRVNLVYFRSTLHTPTLLTPAILACAKKREYAKYPYQRTRDIWASRDDLLAYEEALRVEAEVDELLATTRPVGGYSGRERSTASRTPGPMGGPNRFRTPVTPAKARVTESPVTVKKDMDEEEVEKKNVRNARKLREILEEVLTKWRDLVALKGDEPSRKGLERFDCGHVLTRVVCKGSSALGVLREYDYELEVLEALLAQRRWRRGRRGRWYERRALVLMKKGIDRPEEAMEVVMNALTDPDTHIVYRPMLERRLTRLEHCLKIPMEERHVCRGSLKHAVEVFVEGVRIRHVLTLDEQGKALNVSEKSTLTSYLKTEVKVKHEGKKPVEKNGGKTIWQGRGDEEVSVEQLALQWYEDQHGCKGYHTEGRIVTTLFGLLFYDIIFTPLPGAFETQYQVAPLDLVEDTFYHSRQEVADARLTEIERGEAAEVLEKAYDEHKDVMCVGVRWDLYTKEDLLAITKCMEPKVLGAICRLMCEDYAARTGGVPDLIVWNEEEGWAKFVEVKGPNDNLQENQKVWIDVLLQAGMPVEVCHVYEQGQKPPKPKAMRGVGKTPKTKGKGDAGQSARKRKRDVRVAVSESEDEVDYSQLDREIEDEEHVESPLKKRRKTRNAMEDVKTGAGSPTPQKGARVSNRMEVVIMTPSAASSRNASVSPAKGTRSVGE